MYLEKGYWRADQSRYGRLAWLTQPSWWAVMTYRFGRWTKWAPRVIRPIVHAAYFVAYSFVRLVTGIDIPRGCQIGPGMLIHHFGGIIFNPQIIAGADLTLRHGVTLGSKDLSGSDNPVLGDRVTLGAYAQIMGSVSVGSDATVGAMTLVVKDVRPGATVVGIPAREV